MFEVASNDICLCLLPRLSLRLLLKFYLLECLYTSLKVILLCSESARKEDS